MSTPRDLVRILSLTIPLLAAFLPGPAPGEVPDDRFWREGFHPIGPDASVLCAVADGIGFVAGGTFRYAGASRARGVARWAGDRWEALGDGLGGSTLDLVRYDGGIVACGSFAPPPAPSPNVAIWDGEAWRALGEGLPAVERALAVYEGDLHCGPYRWSGSEWQNLLQTDDVVRDLAIWNGRLVAAGDFLTAGDLAVDHAVAWDGAALHPMPLPEQEILDLEVVGEELYCLLADEYWDPIEQPVRRWDGQVWQEVPCPEPYHWVRKLGEHEGRLVCVVEEWDLLHPFIWNHLYVWDGLGWTTLLDSQYWAAIRLVQPLDGGTLLAGDFDYIEGPDLHVAANLALLRGGALETFHVAGDGLSGRVNALVATSEGVVAGGDFATAGLEPAGRIAAWTGSGWQARGSGGASIGCCTGLDWRDGILYGVMRYQTDVDGSYWLEWDGSTRGHISGYYSYDTCLHDVHVWRGRPLGCGACSGITDLSYYDWFPIWPWFFAATDGVVYALDTWRGELVAAGAFSVIADTPARGVAVYDSVSWRQLGDGLPGRVTAIAVDGERLAATYDSPEGARVVRWDDDGDAWQDLGDVWDGRVHALCFLGPDLYAGGDFLHAGATAAAHVARWDGAGWHPLGSGTDDAVWALAAWNGQVFVGGKFRHAGGKPSLGFAAWQPKVVGVILDDFAARRDESGDVVLTWSLCSGLEGDLRLDRLLSGEPPRRLADWAVAGRGEFSFLDREAPATSRPTYVLAMRWPAGEVEELGRAQAAAAPAAAGPALALAVPQPNPANPAAEIRFTLAAPGPARLTVHDARGRLVAVLADGPLAAGEHVRTWAGTDRGGRRLPAGGYLLRLEADRTVLSRKLTLLP